jgi:hypothetical protein
MKIIPRFNTDIVIRRLCWVAALVMLLDAACTLAGQPTQYWHDPSTADELDPVVRFFMVQGVALYISWVLLRIFFVVVVSSITPRRIGLVILFYFLLEHFCGITSWTLFTFRWSLWEHDALELFIAILIAFSMSKQPPNTNSEGAASAPRASAAATGRTDAL